MDKKTIIGIVLMSAIFIGYMVFNSKQQTQYQQHMEQVQAQQALAEAEQAERAVLRREYIDSVVGNLKGHLDNTYYVDEQGNKEKLKKKGE